MQRREEVNQLHVAELLQKVSEISFEGRKDLRALDHTYSISDSVTGKQFWSEYFCVEAIKKDYGSESDKLNYENVIQNIIITMTKYCDDQSTSKQLKEHFSYFNE